MSKGKEIGEEIGKEIGKEIGEEIGKEKELTDCLDGQEGLPLARQAVHRRQQLQSKHFLPAAEEGRAVGAIQGHINALLAASARPMVDENAN